MLLLFWRSGAGVSVGAGSAHATLVGNGLRIGVGAGAVGAHATLTGIGSGRLVGTGVINAHATLIGIGLVRVVSSGEIDARATLIGVGSVFLKAVDYVWSLPDPGSIAYAVVIVYDGDPTYDAENDPATISYQHQAVTRR